jgi:hypothetical protein
MTEGTNKFKWTEQKRQAAQLVASGELTVPKIGAKLGVSERTLRSWKADPEFAAWVTEIVETTRSAILQDGIAVVANRVGRLNETWNRLWAVVEARAKEHRDNAKARERSAKTLKDGTDPDRPVAGSPISSDLPALAPGGETGLLARQTKLATNGAMVEEFVVDTGLLKELRAHEEQAAKELGQWQDRTTMYHIDPTRLSDEQLERISRGERIERVLAVTRQGRIGAAPAGTDETIPENGA